MPRSFSDLRTWSHVCHLPTFSKTFSSETAGQILLKSNMQPVGKGGKKVCVQFGPGHMTKMAATPIQAKKTKKISYSSTTRPNALKVVCSIWGLVLKFI